MPGVLAENVLRLFSMESVLTENSFYMFSERFFLDWIWWLGDVYENIKTNQVVCKGSSMN